MADFEGLFEGDSSYVEGAKARLLYSSEELSRAALGSQHLAELEEAASFMQDLCSIGGTPHNSEDGLIREYIFPYRQGLKLTVGQNEHMPQINIYGIGRGKKTTLLGHEFMPPGFYNYTDGMVIGRSGRSAWVYRVAEPIKIVGALPEDIIAYRPASEVDLKLVRELLSDAVFPPELSSAERMRKSKLQRTAEFAQKCLFAARHIPPL